MYTSYWGLSTRVEYPQVDGMRPRKASWGRMGPHREGKGRWAMTQLKMTSLGNDGATSQDRARGAPSCGICEGRSLPTGKGTLTRSYVQNSYGQWVLHWRRPGAVVALCGTGQIGFRISS